MSWTQEQTLLFLELFQAESIIWDPKHPEYKDKRKKYDAWMRLGSMLNIPVEELKQKKDSLFATYRGYHRKVQACIKSGAEAKYAYHPVWFAYDTIDQFLGPIFKCRATMTTVQDTEAEEVEEEPEIVMDNSEMLSVDLNDSNDTLQHTTVLKKPQSYKSLRRHRYNLPPPVNNIIYRKTTEVEDECDIFGKLIAKKLKKLPENKRDDLMFDLLSLFRGTNSKTKGSL